MPKKIIKIVIIIPYFGKWPSYFNIYLKGCENNPWLDIIFFTDCEIPEYKSSNVLFHKFNMIKFSQLASEKLDLKINVSNAYKLCDFRPCYGLIFEDYIKDYDYWGYGDIDLIYGNLKPFIVDRIDQGFEVISNRFEILSGSLSIFKNTSFLKNLFKQSEVLINLLSSKNYEGLDETAHNHSTWRGGNKLTLPAHSFTYMIANEDQKGLIKASFITTCKEQIDNEEVIIYKNGVLHFQGSSLAYYHYVCNKNNCEYKLPSWKEVPNHFFISKTGFYKTNKFYRLIHGYRTVSGFMIDITTRIWNRLNKK